ncbi:MAG: SusD/RagB family nutrient-binding outer membrane lipoprotein [Cyclobacteriaceae bacterium]
MNLNKYISSIILTVFLAMGLFSCDSFLDVNVNPNSPVSENLPLNAKLPAALVSAVNQEQGQINQIGGFWGGYWGTNNDGVNLFFSLKTYNGLEIREQRDGIPVWEQGFNNILYFRLVQEEAEASGQDFYSGVSKIMQGWLFLRLVDFYNNIPFDEAVQGNRSLNPTYESGEQVYAKSIDLITQGITEVKSSNMLPSFNHGDILFGGEKTSWVKFGNTIKLRALIRQSEKANASYINGEIEKIQQEGSGFIQAGESALVNPGYLNTVGKLNPFWASYYRDVQGVSTNYHQNIRPTEYLLDQYKQLNDPRMQQLYQDVEGEYKGVLFGNPDAGNPEYARANTSAFKGPVENAGSPTGLFHSIAQSSVLMTDTESLFLQAEAVHRGWLSGDMNQLYENAIRTSLTYLKVAQEEHDTYINQPTILLSGAANPLHRIIQQKWLALNSISSIEAWNDHRRLGLPDFPATIASGIIGRPYRFMYPETERGTNNDEVSAQGSDLMTQNKIWWMP